MIILGIDTSGKTASAAVCSENNVLSQNTIYTKLTHSQVILPITKEAIKNAGLELNDVDVIAAAIGPGSYTGLRIGISAVKAMCFAQNKKCIGISTLESLAYNMISHKGVIYSVMSARADLMYTAQFESDGKSIKRVSNDAIQPLSDIITAIKSQNNEVIIVGDGTATLMENADLQAQTNITYAPPHLRLQLASSLCYAAMAKGENAFCEPDDIDAEYLQITKAEKDLNA